MTEITLSAGGIHLAGDLVIPSAAAELIVFVNEPGTSRLTARNRILAGAMQSHGFGTLQFDLLTPEEVATDRRTRSMRFDPMKLARRLVFVTDWLREFHDTAELDLGYFGTASGTAVALAAAAHRPDRVSAIVSHGGRPDLAIEVLPKVRAATLLAVSANDALLIQLNKHAYGYLRCEKQLDIVPPAETMAARGAEWFLTHVRAAVCA